MEEKKVVVVSPSSQLPCNGTVYSGDAIPGWKCLCRIASLKGHFHCLAPHSVVDYSHECGGDPRIRTGHAYPLAQGRSKVASLAVGLPLGYP